MTASRRPAGVVALGLLLVACQGSPAAPGAAGPGPAGSNPAAEAVQVELDIFSGRSNPTWRLSPKDAARLHRDLAALPPTSARTLHNNLGYRGLIVTGDRHDQIRIQEGTAKLGQTYRADPRRELERWLLSTAGPTVNPQALDAARKAIG